MSEMIDRLRPALLEALAATSAYVRDDGTDGVLVDGVIDPEKVIRAVVAALREPPFDPEAVSYHEGMTRADWWRAMVDAVLSDGSQDEPRRVSEDHP